ncbi:MAG: hypothetical protein BWY63_03589 [Chloroflexi bacterium ADurb.Bin360]|nr:MAG: hypothetical protein BWY63_03589 [Chloroflexi bacterium ADurb.Bin360]
MSVQNSKCASCGDSEIVGEGIIQLSNGERYSGFREFVDFGGGEHAAIAGAIAGAMALGENKQLRPGGRLNSRGEVAQPILTVELACRERGERAGQFQHFDRAKALCTFSR